MFIETAPRSSTGGDTRKDSIRVQMAERRISKDPWADAVPFDTTAFKEAAMSDEEFFAQLSTYITSGQPPSTGVQGPWYGGMENPVEDGDFGGKKAGVCCQMRSLCP